MAELDVRIRRPFTLGDLRRETIAVLERVAPGERAGALSVVGSTSEYFKRGTAAAPASDETLTGTCGTGGGSDHAILVLPEGAVQVLCVTEGLPGEEETGPVLAVSAIDGDRPASRALAVAVALAAAHLTGGGIADPEGTLDDATPDHALSRLAAEAGWSPTA